MGGFRGRYVLVLGLALLPGCDAATRPEDGEGDLMVTVSGGRKNPRAAAAPAVPAPAPAAAEETPRAR